MFYNDLFLGVDTPSKKSKNSSDYTTLQVKANLELLSLTLNKKGKKLSVVSLKNSSTVIKFKEDENMLIEVEMFPWAVPKSQGNTGKHKCK